MIGVGQPGAKSVRGLQIVAHAMPRLRRGDVVGLDCRPQRPDRVVQPGARRADRDVQHLGDLLERKAEVHVKHDDRPMRQGELREPALEPISASRDCVDVSTIAASSVSRRRGITDRRRFDFRVARIDHEPIRPRVEPLRIAERWQLAPRDGQCLLRSRPRRVPRREGSGRRRRPGGRRPRARERRTPPRHLAVLVAPGRIAPSTSRAGGSVIDPPAEYERRQRQSVQRAGSFLRDQLGRGRR